MSKNAWQNIGLAVLTVIVLAGAVWTVVRPYPGESWHPPPRPAAATSQQAQRSTQQTAAFVGDSYVAGTGATRPAKRWSSQVARRMMGWQEINFGQDGTGYVNPSDSADESALPQRLKPVIAAHADVVVVSTGRNDVGGGSMGEIRTAVNQTFRRLRAGLPHARIVAVAPLWPGDSFPAKLTRISKAVRSAAARFDAQYVATRPWYDDLSQRLASDGVDPDNAGYRLLANKVSAALS